MAFLTCVHVLSMDGPVLMKLNLEGKKGQQLGPVSRALYQRLSEALKGHRVMSSTSAEEKSSRYYILELGICISHCIIITPNLTA